MTEIYAPADREPLPSGLIPAERLAVTVARNHLERGENPPENITAVLLMAVDRLAPFAAAWTRLREKVTYHRDVARARSADENTAAAFAAPVAGEE